MAEVMFYLVAVALCVTALVAIFFALADAMLKDREVDWTRVRLQAIERRRREGIDE
jgi:hypothetical protein